MYIYKISCLKPTSARQDGSLFAPSSQMIRVTGFLEDDSSESPFLTSGKDKSILLALKKELKASLQNSCCTKGEFLTAYT